jgi:uncharacterized membrane protein HdeD (DUF308 family)
MANRLVALQAAWRRTRAFDWTVAGINLLAGFTVAASLSSDIPIHLVLLGIALMALGIREVALGVTSIGRTLPIRGLEAAAGVASTSLGFLVTVFPGFGVATLIWFLFLGLFSFGAAQIGNGLTGTQLPPWLRGYFVAIGTFNLLLTPFLLLAPGRPRITLILLLSAAVVANGIAILVRARIALPSATGPTRARDSNGRSLK